jgi:ABC-type glycerol-3-phosphate transport system substrate-binding protein
MTNYGAFSLDNLMLLQLVMDREDSELMPFPGITSGVWQPSTIASISADTKVAAFAASFLQIMLSTEVQQINYGMGMPVTKAGVDEQIKTMNEMFTDNDIKPLTLDIDALIGSLTTPSINDMTLSEMIKTSVEKLCKGETDVGGAVSEIEQNIKNYLAERA